LATLSSENVNLPNDVFSYKLAWLLSRKRTCQLNLGGHCATEDAASMTKQWHFLNSGFSPGRRRRSVVQQGAIKDGSKSTDGGLVTYQ